MISEGSEGLNPQKLVKTVGNYVEGDRFWGREREVELFIEDLNAGANILLVAQRLKMALGLDLYPLALGLLTESAVVGVLTPAAVKVLGKESSIDLGSYSSIDAAFQEILMVLEHDGYLKKSQTGYVFVSKLIRDWWVARYEFNFIPTAERS